MHDGFTTPLATLREMLHPLTEPAEAWLPYQAAYVAGVLDHPALASVREAWEARDAAVADDLAVGDEASDVVSRFAAEVARFRDALDAGKDPGKRPNPDAAMTALEILQRRKGITAAEVSRTTRALAAAVDAVRDNEDVQAVMVARLRESRDRLRQAHAAFLSAYAECEADRQRAEGFRGGDAQAIRDSVRMKAVESLGWVAGGHAAVDRLKAAADAFVPSDAYLTLLALPPRTLAVLHEFVSRGGRLERTATGDVVIPDAIAGSEK